MRKEAEQKLVDRLGLKATIKQEKVNGHVLNYLVAGSGPPLILIHGINIGWGQWYPNIPELAKRFRVYAIDLPGSGGSSALDYENMDMEKDFVEIVERFIIKKKLRSINIIGHSLGGWIALQLAIRGKIKIGKMLLISPLGLSRYVPPKFIPITFRPIAKFLAAGPMKLGKENLSKIIGQLVGKLNLAEEFLDYYYTSLLEREPSAHPFLFINGLCVPWQMRSELVISAPYGIQVETLIIGGKYDFMVKPGIINDKAGPLLGAKIIIFENSGHVAALEESVRFNELSKKFFLDSLK